MKYGAIYADPPWHFETRSPKGRGRSPAYLTENLDVLAALQAEAPIEQLAADDSALFMWVIDSHLDQALQLMRAWDFQYKTVAFVWDKGPKIGMGYWTRKQAEICLLGTRGSPKRLDAGVPQIIRAPRREHSRKPDETRALIQRLVAGPYLELFARQTTPGWDVFGNETTKFAA